MDKNQVAAEIIAAFLTEPTFVEDLPDKEDKFYKTAKSCEYRFTTGVQALKGASSPVVRKLAENIWNVIGKKHVQTALGPKVPSLYFAKIGRQSTILFPHDWPEKTEEDPFFQLCAILFVGSQAVDDYNGRFYCESADLIMRRARCYEAELIHSVGHKPKNDYHRGVVKDFPGGWDSKYAYAMKKVEAPT